MANSLVALGTAAAIGAAALTTSTPAAAQAWIAPVIVGSVISGAVVGGSTSLALLLRPLLPALRTALLPGICGAL
jgi:hypothetical protein